jgi:hypothetical protein
MNVVSRSADGFGNCVCSANQSAEIFVQTISPVVGEKWMTVFCAEHDMHMQAQVGGWHKQKSPIKTKCEYGDF